MAAPAVGIDLGTTFSCVAVWREGAAEVIANAQGNRTTPSRVVVDPPLVGDAALTHRRAIYDAKRMIGRTTDELAAWTALWPFTVEEDARGRAAVREDATLHTPEEISARVLTELRETASAFLGVPVTKAVITVPAYFRDVQRQATKEAGRLAGLEVLRLVNEPTAAAMAYGAKQQQQQQQPDRANDGQRVLVFDWGGGTLDVSALRLENQLFRVESTAGDSNLGGQDIDAALVAHCRAQPGRGSKPPTARALQRLRRECERAKRVLSTTSQTMIEVEAFCGGEDLSVTLTRAKLEELCGALWERLLKPIDRVMAEVPHTPDKIVLVGGSTRIPKVRALLAARFPDVPLTTEGIHPDEAVACGAALQAAQLSGALTAPEKVLLLDVTPITLGVETAGGQCTAVVPRSSTIPCEVQRTFSTYMDRQTSVRVKVLEGECARAASCHVLGTFELGPLPPLPRGAPRIQVTFRINADGILEVSATCDALSEKLVVQQVGRSSPAKPDDDDLRWAQRLEAQHALEHALHTMSTTLRSADFRRTHAKSAVSALRDDVAEAHLWLTAQGREPDECATRMRELQEQLRCCPRVPETAGV